VTEVDLSRSYRRLLRAYPLWYRRERDVEMLTTLLDAAAPGQRRPNRRDAIDLIVGGLRCRLRPPHGFGYRLIVVLLATFTALAGLALAGRAVPPGAPTQNQALAAASVAIPGPPHQVAGPQAPCRQCPDWDSGPLKRTDYVAVFYDPAPGDVPTVMSDARNRLAAAGWQVDPDVVVDRDSGDYVLKAEKDGIALSLRGSLGQVYVGKDPSRPDPDFHAISMVVTRSFADLSAGILAAGFLGGLLAGWLLSVWVLQRFRRHRTGIRAVLVVAGLPALLLAIAVDGVALQWAIGLTALGNWSWTYLLLPSTWATGVPELAVITAVAVLLPVGLAALPIRPRTRYTTASPAS
jgi:hypothetical protein